MNSLTGLFRSSPWPRAIALALVSIGAAGCSAESTRFGESPYAARGGAGEVTGAIPSGQGAPAGRVETRPLPQTSQLPPAQSPAPVASTVVGGGGRGMASYGPQVAPYNAAPYNAAAYTPPAAPAIYNPPPSPAAYTPPPSPAAYNPAAYSPATYSPPPYNPAPGPEFTGSVAPPPSV
jgi:hypothetical protein